jgi:hypothetical protein
MTFAVIGGALGSALSAVGLGGATAAGTGAATGGLAGLGGSTALGAGTGALTGGTAGAAMAPAISSAITPALASTGGATAAAAPTGLLGASGNAALTSGLSAPASAGWGGGAASAAPAASASGGSGIMGTVQNLLGNMQAGTNKGGGGGGGSGGPLGEIGALLSKSKNSGQMPDAATPKPIDLSQGIQAAAEARAASDPGQAEQSPMDINGFISQVMGRG